jgi:hypothetical protein
MPVSLTAYFIVGGFKYTSKDETVTPPTATFSGPTACFGDAVPLTITGAPATVTVTLRDSVTNIAGDGYYEILYVKDLLTSFGIGTHTPGMVVVKLAGTSIATSNVIHRGFGATVIGGKIFSMRELRVFGGIGAPNLQVASVTAPAIAAGAVTAPAIAAGATSLAAGSDVLIASPADGDLLSYNSGASKWENVPALGSTGGSGGLADLTIAGHAANSDGDISLTGAIKFVADQSFVPSGGQILIVKAILRISRSGAGSGGGFIFRYTSGGHTYKFGFDALSTSPRLFYQVDAGAITGGPSLPAQAGTVRHFMLFAVQMISTGMYLVYRSGISSASMVDMEVNQAAGVPPTPLGQTWNIDFYVDDNSTSTIEYFKPVAGLRNASLL